VVSRHEVLGWTATDGKPPVASIFAIHSADFVALAAVAAELDRELAARQARTGGESSTQDLRRWSKARERANADRIVAARDRVRAEADRARAAEGRAQAS